ncbi:ATP-dependent 6-phosphofructokinase [Flammeovirga yaeyamensis]|uniref:ATP-dependent 6-phosphofructokinase n=1 Tax=Flammeovirga yaeyamensis TaxID=367791 RepID=A0AAX1N468_9BACT|nr:ATP-dependent 6-phosphofructokinase [Flammeovirga yaeyamensis]MBB3698470.1 6-phosphofructokinase 1 [Flammeovirga yaeyamensis]NMF34181.1 ATP-dependent 6-phosphofructokinase [Flammeovirga yaeyamensis]QWG01166.1 ATP-dependent 6-phosphofructokinase [Flammeovirga yaeyamensis]
MNDLTRQDFEVTRLGKATLTSPLYKEYKKEDAPHKEFIEDSRRIIYDASLSAFEEARNSDADPISFLKAGPRKKIYFDPSKTKAAIVTCGGLCPGINNVIRGLVNGLYYRYNVKNIWGVQYGYQGFISDYGHEMVKLTPNVVKDIHLFGGTILGSSRGRQDISAMVDTLERENINILFTIGGDGTLSGNHVIHEEIERRGLKIVTAGIPKTIDNDVNFMTKTFGFDTAFSTAAAVVRDAHNEATGAYNGVAIVKLMGRDSGFIAANAALAMPDVNFVLIPESKFDLYGDKGFLNTLKKRVEERHHALVVVAEGAGQHLFEDNENEVVKDKSGNIKHKDIGVFLKDEITNYLKEQDMEATVKYIDPSYIIRSEVAIPADSVFCNDLALNAVHGAMAGITDFVVGRWHNQFTYLPIPVATASRKKIDIDGALWWSVLETTGQPVDMTND